MWTLYFIIGFVGFIGFTLGIVAGIVTRIIARIVGVKLLEDKRFGAYGTILLVIILSLFFNFLTNFVSINIYLVIAFVLGASLGFLICVFWKPLHKQ